MLLCQEQNLFTCPNETPARCREGAGPTWLSKGVYSVRSTKIKLLLSNPSSLSYCYFGNVTASETLRNSVISHLFPWQLDFVMITYYFVFLRSRKMPYYEHIRKERSAIQNMTKPLKMWLYRNKAHPYPTKADKMELADHTNMTFTQVSVCLPPLPISCSVDMIIP